MTSDPITKVAAAGAVASPLWIPKLSELSTMAAEVLPILGAIWLVVQIVAKVYPAIRGKPKED